MPRAYSLVVMPSLPAIVEPDGRVVLTHKFLSGMQEYVNRWPGPVVCVMQPARMATNNLDQVTVSPRELPFELHVMSCESPGLAEIVDGAGVVLSGLDYGQNHVVDLCISRQTPVVVCSEYSLETRCQIASTEVRSWPRRWRRMFWEWGQERVNRRNVQRASGVQCNGTPTFDAYQRLNRHTLLYFDTRTRDEMVIDRARLDCRINQLRAGGPLRLAFSGRLIAMKGADQLPRLAHELRRLGVPFELTICGDGALRGLIEQQIKQLELGGSVRLAGTLDFATALTPLLQNEIDLFVCPHGQGDPSCTYLETMACGVPIVGYANSAWRGLLQHVAAGWQTPLNDPAALAQAVAKLAENRERLALASLRAREFAAEQTFERVFQRRIEHLQACAGVLETVRC